MTPARRTTGPFSVLAVSLLAGCAKGPPPGPPPPEVSTLTVTPKPATFTVDYVASTEAINTVEIRPRVTGVLEKQLPNEGEHVKPGELLFVIDQQPYIAALAQAKATLAESQATLEQAQHDLARAQSLALIDAISQQELDAAIARAKAGLAAVDAGKAAVKTAQLNLGYTSITSPIDGVMGRAQMRLGSLATANTSLLTTLYQTDRMYVNLSISEARLLALQRQYGRALNQRSTTAPPFRLFLVDGSEYPEAPKLNFIAPAVDDRTGTLAVRLEVPNPKQLLHAGQFARVQVAAVQDPHAIVVPLRAIQELQGKNFVWILDANGKAQQRDVRMGLRTGTDWQVEQGLKAGDVVIVDGVQRLHPGSAVKATPLATTAPATNTAAGSGA
jgi:membrane fusion protein, multidrug efflux system